MQTALQPIRLFCFILALSCLYQHLWARCALVFQYKGQTQFMIDDSGNVIDARIIQNAADATPDEALIIEKNHQLMLWAHDNHVFIPGALHECTDTAAYPNTGLQFKTNELGHAAELTDAGDLYISGKETVRQPTAMITYVDNSAVYELNADKVNELQYHHLGTPLGTEGRIFADNRTEFYVKDHLVSVRSVIAERPNGQGYDVVEYTSYYHYGSIKDALERPGQVREKFTGKEFDEDGQSNGSPGLQLYYFGARFYDPVVGVWLSVDKAEQFFSPYAYAGNGANPVVMVDKDGNFIFTSLAIAFGVGFGIGYVGHGIKTDDWGWNAVTTGLWSGLGVAALSTGNPWVIGGMVGAFSTVGGVNNVIANSPGIDNFGEGMAAFLGGSISGAMDGANALTAGVFSYPAGVISGEAMGISHNVVFDKKWNDSESRNMAKEMLSRQYSYGAAGSLIKVAGDIVWSHHVRKGNPAVDPQGGIYKETQNRFKYMRMKINREGEYYGKTIEGNNWKNGKITKYGIGHRLGGFFFPSKPYYYAFEVWGEGYMQWEEDDYIDDGNKGYLFDKPWEVVW